MADIIRGNCPFCGKMLEIPAELTEFSCLYCGERSRTSILSAQENYDETPLLTLAAELPQAITPYPKYFKKVTKKDYVPTFASYEAAHEALLTKLDVAICNDPRGLDTAVDAVCETLLDALEAHIMAHKKDFFPVKSVLALFFTPLVKKLHLRCAERFCACLHEKWLKRFPTEVWMHGDYFVICDGFSRSKLCFITTATCAREGKPDDCAELTAFRAFRDGWLTAHNADLIEEYYAIAPTIVTAIGHCDDADARYAEIRMRWLTPCLKALRDNKNTECRDIYIDMVQSLRKKYLPQ